MKTNGATQSETALQTLKSGGEVAEKKTKQRLPKTHQEYWKDRLFHEAYTRGDGGRVEIPELSVRVQHLGKRFAFGLNTSNRETAAAKARDIHLSLVTHGWEKALAQYAPQVSLRNAKSEAEPTVGDFLAEAERVSGLKPRTFHRCAQCFRMIAAFVGGVEDVLVQRETPVG